MYGMGARQTIHRTDRVMNSMTLLPMIFVTKSKLKRMLVIGITNSMSVIYILYNLFVLNPVQLGDDMYRHAMSTVSLAYIGIDGSTRT